MNNIINHVGPKRTIRLPSYVFKSPTCISLAYNECVCFVCSCLGVYQQRRDLTTSMFSVLRVAVAGYEREVARRYVRYDDNDDDDDERASIVCTGRSSCFPTRNCYVIPCHRSPRGAKRPNPDDAISKLRSFYDALAILEAFCLDRLLI